MTVSRTELIGIVAILLYIVFFSHSPPYALRSALGNVYVAGTIFAALTYVTLCINQSIGVLMIVAFILTMTRVTEHLDAGVTPPVTPPPDTLPPTNIPVPLAPPALSTSTAGSSSIGTTMDSQGNIVNANGTIAQAAGTPTSTGVTAGATTAAAPAQAPPPVATATPPAPVMSCNIESFAPF